MYFSLIEPVSGSERDAVYQRTDGPYSDHQWLWRWFPSDPGSPRDFLFRRFDSRGPASFYVVSKRKPLDSLGAWKSQAREYRPDLAAGDEFQFDLRANPTVRHGRDGTSKRHDVVMEAKRRLLAERGLTQWSDWTDGDKPADQDLAHTACCAWLARRGGRSGFEMNVDSVVLEAYERQKGREDRTLAFTSVDLGGTLTVTDPTAFRDALFSGLGSAKAFGCGLLLIRRSG